MRNRLLTTALVLGVSLLMVVPPATSQVVNPNQPTPTTLYFHIFDVFNVFPINTQAPNATFFRVGGTNFPTIASQGYDFNTIYGFSTSGPVEYGFIENGQPRFHPERGIARDVTMVEDVTTYPVSATLYISARNVIGQNSSAAGIIPYFNMKVTVRDGNQYGDPTDLDQGGLIMQGHTIAHLSRSAADATIGGQETPDGVPILAPDWAGVHELKIPMTLHSNKILKTEGYNVRIDWWQDVPNGQAEDEFSEGFLRLVSDVYHPPRLDFAIMNPVYIEFIHPQVAAGILLIHTAMNSPWGTYDVDLRNVTIEIRDAQGNVVPAALERVISQNAHVHDLHDKPAEVTWLWRFRDEGAKDGTYSIHLSVPNNACTKHTDPAACARATGQAGFVLEGREAYGVDEGGQKVEVIRSDDEQKSPSPGILLGAAVIGLAALLRRRR